MNTKRFGPDDVVPAAEIIRGGGLLGIPTETVYGLGANGLDPEAVANIFAAKGRPQDNPLIIHVTGAQWLPRYCADVPPLRLRGWSGTAGISRMRPMPSQTASGPGRSL